MLSHTVTLERSLYFFEARCSYSEGDIIQGDCGEGDKTAQDLTLKTSETGKEKSSSKGVWKSATQKAGESSTVWHLGGEF